jgi:hypothetical protein
MQMQTVPPPEQVLQETRQTRARAVELLRTLERAHAECERHVDRVLHPDSMKRVTGRSALENAIASTRRMIDSLDRAVEAARREAETRP